MKDDAGVTDVQILTVQVTDVNEPPQFQGSLAQGETYPGSGIREDPAGHSQTEGKKKEANKQLLLQRRQLLNEQGEMGCLPLRMPSRDTQQLLELCICASLCPSRSQKKAEHGDPQPGAV